jgi:predicted nucleic acid-binding protein
MYKKIFLDANVIVDIYDDSRTFYPYSTKVFEYIFEDENIELYTSCDIVTTIYYLLAKQNKKLALDAIIDINEACQVVEFGNLEVTKSCKLMKEDKNFTDLEDTIQFVMAQKVGADLILSNDQSFVSDKIELMNTKALYEKLTAL